MPTTSINAGESHVESLPSTFFHRTVQQRVSGCTPESATSTNTTAAQAENTEPTVAPRFGAVTLDMPSDIIIGDPNAKNRNAYFGGTFIQTIPRRLRTGTVATPYDAYRYAQGECCNMPAGLQCS